MNKKEEKPVALDISSLDIYSLLEIFINILSAQAWQYMGLRVKPGTDKVEMDFKRASIAIDCIAFLIDKLELQLPDSERDGLRHMLTDLQINFTRLSTAK